MIRLSLGPEVIGRLLPHREPFVLVDRIHGWDEVTSAVHASLRVRSEAPVLAGHFPGAPIWPGAYTIEGLAQTAGLLPGLALLGRRAREAGVGLDELEPSVPAGAPAVGVLAKVEVRLLGPVRPDATLEYRVVRTHDREGISRFEAEAIVDRTLVAQGVLVVAAALEGRVR